MTIIMQHNVIDTDGNMVLATLMPSSLIIHELCMMHNLPKEFLKPNSIVPPLSSNKNKSNSIVSFPKTAYKINKE